MRGSGGSCCLVLMMATGEKNVDIKHQAAMKFTWRFVARAVLRFLPLPFSPCVCCVASLAAGAAGAGNGISTRDS